MESETYIDNVTALLGESSKERGSYRVQEGEKLGNHTITLMDDALKVMCRYLVVLIRLPHRDGIEQGRWHLSTRNVLSPETAICLGRCILHVSRSWFQAERGKAGINALTITLIDKPTILFTIRWLERWDGAGNSRCRPSRAARRGKETMWLYNICCLPPLARTRPLLVVLLLSSTSHQSRNISVTSSKLTETAGRSPAGMADTDNLTVPWEVRSGQLQHDQPGIDDSRSSYAKKEYALVAEISPQIVKPSALLHSPCNRSNKKVVSRIVDATSGPVEHIIRPEKSYTAVAKGELVQI